MPIDREVLKAYLRLRRLSRPVTVRGFQRLMGYSSPGQAERVLKGLERLGLIEKTLSSEYIAKNELPPRALSVHYNQGVRASKSLCLRNLCDSHYSYIRASR